MVAAITQRRKRTRLNALVRLVALHSIVACIPCRLEILRMSCDRAGLRRIERRPQSRHSRGMRQMVRIAES
jgi:hypothetical protein